MKKKIFTLICLSFLLSGAAFTAMAQTAVFEKAYKAYPYSNAGVSPNDFVEASSPIYSNSEYEVEVKSTSSLENQYFYIALYGEVKRDGTKIGTDSLTAYLSENVRGKKFTVPAKDSITVKFSISDLPVPNGGVYDSVYVVALRSDKNATKPPVYSLSPSNILNRWYANFYNYPKITVSYVEPSPNYDGKADISVVGGSKLLQYSLTGGVTWFKVYDKDGKIIKLSDTEISNIPRVIYFKEPNTPTYISYELWAENPPYPIIPRAITILPVSGATLSHTGLVFAESGKDFVLTITVADQTKEPKVTTGRNLPADQDVVSEYLGNGVYKITIKRVTSPINLGIDLVAGSEAVDGSSVWSAGGQLYVTGVTAATAQIYGATGTLVKQLTLGAGETTAVSLPAGFYIVTLNGKAYKVILK